MAHYIFIHASFLLLGTCISFGVIFFNGLMLAEVRRRRLKQVAVWLVPATGSAAIAGIIFAFSDLRLWLGLRETLTYYFFTTSLTSFSYLLTAWATVGLWKMIRTMPDGPSAKPPQGSETEIATVWPPPPGNQQ